MQLVDHTVYKHGTGHEGRKQYQHFLRQDTLSGTSAMHATSSTPGVFCPWEHAQRSDDIRTSD